MEGVSDQVLPFPTASAAASEGEAARRRLVLQRIQPRRRPLARQRIQPGLVGLIDGTISTLAPIFAAAFLAGSRAALLVGLASALGRAGSMGAPAGQGGRRLVHRRS